MTMKIPDSLVYEEMEHQPIYYKNYEEVLVNGKSKEDIMGTSIFQAKWFVCPCVKYL